MELADSMISGTAVILTNSSDLTGGLREIRNAMEVLGFSELIPEAKASLARQQASLNKRPSDDDRQVRSKRTKKAEWSQEDLAEQERLLALSKAKAASTEYMP